MLLRRWVLAKRKKGRRSPRAQGARRYSRAADELQSALKRAESLIERGRAHEAIALLGPLLSSYPRVAELHYYLGYAGVTAGDLWLGLTGYERALELSRDPGYWLPLASLYLELGLKAHALHAFRQVQKHQVDVTTTENVRQAVASLESDVAELAERLGLSAARVAKGLRQLEEGQLALQAHDLRLCIAASRRAIKLLPDWPPPQNNLSLALFFDGQPQEAVATARRVLTLAPDNVQALSNAIRFLAWTGDEEQARRLWARLKEITPQDNVERFKMAEAAAVLDQDESVYALLEPLDRSDATEVRAPELSRRIQFLLAVAEANLGRREARRRLEALQGTVPWVDEYLVALKAGRPGPGWAGRFPYFNSIELMPMHPMEEFIELVGLQDEISPKQFRTQVAHYTSRYPQLVLMAEKLIWEEDQPGAGTTLLSIIATPAAYDALRRYGLSQVGEDEARMQVLIKLAKAGEIAPNETVRFWARGQWQDVKLHQLEISDARVTAYTPQMTELTEQGLQAFQSGDLDRAERLFRRALELEPRAKEVYNNLATVYSRRGDTERAKEMLRVAIEIDPLYAFPRCNLALYLLDEDDVEGAAEVLAPLTEATQFHAQEMAFYSYTQARLLIARGEYEPARRALEMAVQVWPDYELAKDLLERMETVTLLHTGFDSLVEQMHQRNLARRERLQAKLSTPDPSLSGALSLYTKDVLTGMGRVILPWGGWSALRKAELLEQILAGLEDGDNIMEIASYLNEKERDALRQVLERGGHMPWKDFDARFGNDLEESPHWQYHEPETVMGRLRLRGLLVETTVDDELLVAIPSELRRMLAQALD